MLARVWKQTISLWRRTILCTIIFTLNSLVSSPTVLCIGSASQLVYPQMPQFTFNTALFCLPTQTDVCSIRSIFASITVPASVLHTQMLMPTYKGDVYFKYIYLSTSARCCTGAPACTGLCREGSFTPTGLVK